MCRRIIMDNVDILGQARDAFIWNRQLKSQRPMNKGSLACLCNQEFFQI